MGQEVQKIFDTYWTLAAAAAVPSSWPTSLDTTYNSQNPIGVDLNGTSAALCLSVSPPRFEPNGWTDDECRLSVCVV